MEPVLVRNIMTVGVPTCKTTTLALDVARYLLEKNIEEMVVLNEEGEGVGVCGYEQLIAVFGCEDIESLTAEAIMREGVPDLPAELPIAVAAHMMKDQGIRAAYMTHNSAGIIYPAASISYWHILRSMTARGGEDLNDLGIAAKRTSPLDAFIQRRDEARRKAGLK